MRGFIVLCLVALATGDNLGYNYQPVGHDSASGSAYTGGSNGASIIGGSDHTSSGSSNSIASGSGAIGGIGSGFGGFAGSNDAGNYGGSLGSNGGVGAFESSATPVSSSEFNKEFYTYSAPEEEFNDNSASQRIAESLRKNLRVVFIKAPENQALTNAALQLAKQASEDRTAIYVLNKQADIGDLASKLQALKNNNAHKPEVHFVKYRTPEDAVRAQQAIQAQYDALGGESHTSNEGVAPVLNFASPAARQSSSSGFASSQNLGGAVGGSSSSSSQSGGDYASSAKTYLPPALRRQ